MPSRARKVDRNHGEVIKEFRRLGCSVQDLSGVGKGVPDLLVGAVSPFLPFRSNILVEIKDGPKAKLTPDQVKWHGEWKGQVCVVRNLEDVRNLVKLYRGE